MVYILHWIFSVRSQFYFHFLKIHKVGMFEPIMERKNNLLTMTKSPANNDRCGSNTNLQVVTMTLGGSYSTNEGQGVCRTKVESNRGPQLSGSILSKCFSLSWLPESSFMFSSLYRSHFIICFYEHFFTSVRTPGRKVT